MKRKPARYKKAICKQRGSFSLALDMLRKENFNVITWDDVNPIPQDKLIENAKQCNALFCTLTAKIDAAFLNECKHLEIISQFGVGYDNINIPEATKLGIPVGNTPGVLTGCYCRYCFWINDSRIKKKCFSCTKKLRKANGNILRQHLISAWN